MTPFVHSIALVMSTNLVADQVRGFAALADICFWTSQQSKSSKLGKEELLSRLQHALDQYQQDKKDVIIQAICHMPNVSKEAVKHLILQHGQFSPVAKAQAL
ncbi:hypothetical protein FRB95_009549 [Tulasnella sp. JGI-2019a]|nr:hypothetical protein FRB95_009549 [Tulasnella sp. JGI-2019a]